MMEKINHEDKICYLISDCYINLLNVDSLRLIAWCILAGNEDVLL